MPPHTNSNTVTVSQIARHWGFTSPTVRHLLNRTSTVPLSTGPARYRWCDVWALEGAGYVSPINEAEFRRPLLTPAE